MGSLLWTLAVVAYIGVGFVMLGYRRNEVDCIMDAFGIVAIWPLFPLLAAIEIPCKAAYKLGVKLRERRP